MQAELIVLRFIHVVGGMFWVGTGVFTSIYLMPALASVGPASGQVMAALQSRKLFVALPLTAVLTILSGLRLMWLTSAGFQSFYFQSGMGRAFAFGGLCGILAFLFGLLVHRPLADKVGKLGGRIAAATDSDRPRLQAEMATAQARLKRSGLIALVLLLLAAAGMAVARYVG